MSARDLHVVLSLARNSMLTLFGLDSVCSDRNSRTFQIKGIRLKIEVEHDFSGSLSQRVTLKFFWQHPNFMAFFNPQGFRLGGSYNKLAMRRSLEYNMWDFEWI